MRPGTLTAAERLQLSDDAFHAALAGKVTALPLLVERFGRPPSPPSW
jgi:hypothetical protein